MGRAKPPKSTVWPHGFGRRAWNPCSTRQPGGTLIGDRIREIRLDSRSTGLAPMTEMALMFADRAQAIAEVIVPALEAGKIVVCDRFTDSTEAYQGGGRELGSRAVLELHRLVCGNLQPDLTLLLLPSLVASLARARRRNHRVEAQTGKDENRFEREQNAFHARVWEKYREMPRANPSACADRGRPVHRRDSPAHYRSGGRTDPHSPARRLKDVLSDVSEVRILRRGWLVEKLKGRGRAQVGGVGPGGERPHHLFCRSHFDGLDGARHLLRLQVPCVDPIVNHRVPVGQAPRLLQA